jgi:hypothetical protein
LLFAVFRQSVYRRQLMRGRKVSVPDSHLDVLVTSQFLNGTEIDSGHD